MPEYRDCQVMVNLEPTVMAEIKRVMKEEKVTGSNYLRSLAIRDLVARGLLNSDKLALMVTTDSPVQMQQRIKAIQAG